MTISNTLSLHLLAKNTYFQCLASISNGRPSHWPSHTFVLEVTYLKHRQCGLSKGVDIQGIVGRRIHPVDSFYLSSSRCLSFALQLSAHLRVHCCIDHRYSAVSGATIVLICFRRTQSACVYTYQCVRA